MENQNVEKELSAALRAAGVVIAYAPLPDEPGFASAFALWDIVCPTSGLSVLADRHADPVQFAAAAANRYAGKRVVVLIPGQAFDASGTRHGRGGGWYDRFLAAVPRAWLRVGVLHANQLSAEPLKRESWDEPMDWLLVRSEECWEVLKI